MAATSPPTTSQRTSGMSPGNLYYHFRNREEIMRAIFPHLVAHGLAATAPPASGVLTAGRRDITRSDVAEGALHSFLVVAPFLAPPFAAEARAVIEGHGRPESAARRSEIDPGARTRRARGSARARTRHP
jgi:AcrR family transcriptional regulator